MFNMSKEDKFNYDIANLRQDFAIENMNITDSDIEVLRRFSNNEISQAEMISLFKNNTLKGV